MVGIDGGGRGGSTALHGVDFDEVEIHRPGLFESRRCLG